jgi:hypothetical protein
MTENYISASGIVSGFESNNVEEPKAEEVTTTNMLKWKAGSHEWLILGCLTIITLVVVSQLYT